MTKKDETGRQHALLSASSSHRWLNCPPSARFCEQYEDKSSSYAAEGTDAHTLGEYKLNVALGRGGEGPTTSLAHYSEEMEVCATWYAASLMELVEAAKCAGADPVVFDRQCREDHPAARRLRLEKVSSTQKKNLKLCRDGHLIDKWDNPLYSKTTRNQR